MKIGNVIYENGKELVNHTKVDYINYISDGRQYKDVNKLLPTLFVGWSFMRENNLDNEIISIADILDKRIITNELYWEYSFNENKSEHVKGIDNFVKNVPEYFFYPRYVYTDLDPIFFQISDIQDLIDILPKEISRVYKYKNDFLYAYSNKKIWGINLKTYKFFQFDVIEMIKKITERSVYVIDDDCGQYYQEVYKTFPNFDRLKRYMVTILV